MQYHDPSLKSRPLVLGHRGARRLLPENTLESLMEALVQGAEGVEYDVQISSDDAPFLFHDDTLLHACGIPGPPHHHPLAFLESLAPHRNIDGEPTRAHIPSLERILDRVGGIHDLEIKIPAEDADEVRERLVPLIVELFTHARGQERISPLSAITSFDLPSLDLAAGLEPGCRLGAIVETRSQWEAVSRWKPVREPAVLVLAFPLAVEVLPPGSPLPEPFSAAELWFWNIPEESPRETLRWSPDALIVDDLSVRSRLRTSRESSRET